MDITEKKLRLETIEMALTDINRIIKSMEENNYPKEQINDYYKKRWELWNEQYRTKSS